MAHPAQPSKFPVLVPLALWVAAHFIPALPVLGGVPAGLRVIASVLFFVFALLIGAALTRDKPTRGEVFLASVALSVVFFFSGAGHVAGIVNEMAATPHPVEVEYAGIREEAAKAEGEKARYYVLVKLPGDAKTQATPAVVPVPQELFQDLRNRMPEARTPVTLALSRGLLGMFSVAGLQEAQPLPNWSRGATRGT